METYWYEEPGMVEHMFYGVFEGGGAKGLAYVGALRAMKKKKCWFRGVAGASAGAITAALIASGLSPEEMENATESALKSVQTGVWDGLFRLRAETGYFASGKLRKWVDDLLIDQVMRKNGTKPEENVTFLQLQDATKIELNIVAADLSLRRQIIFSHIETPNCVVADAVVASAAVPFAFPSLLLHVPERHNGEQVYHHTIVDGGVWSNFPMFIFEDRDFRNSYQRDPKEIDPERVLGFILKSEDKQARPSGKDVKFVEVRGKEIRAREWGQDTQTVIPEPSGLGYKVATWLLYPFSLLGRFVEWNGGVERGRWPAPRSKLVRNLVDSISGMLAGIYPLLFGLIACAVVFFGAWVIINFLITDQIVSFRSIEGGDIQSYLIRISTFLLRLVVVAVGILVVFVSVLSVVANFLLLRASRRILYGLVTTYVSGPGAPEWATLRKNIIALPIPSTVKTLSFEIGMKERKDLIESAERATLARLEEILADGSHTA